MTTTTPWRRKRRCHLKLDKGVLQRVLILSFAGGAKIIIVSNCTLVSNSLDRAHFTSITFDAIMNV
jgi:hypothetical protein